MRSINPVQELDRLVREGISTDFYLAYEAYGIFRTIGERTPSANASTYRAMLVALQSYASAEFVLAITRLLERQGERYELHSVHGVLMFLKDKAREIPVQQALWVQQSMERLGVWDRVPHESGPKQTRAVVDAVVAKLPHHTNDSALKALKDLRDKRIAHPERATPEGLQTTTWDKALKLLDVPLEALGICSAFTSTAYVDDSGQLMTAADAASAGNATRRFLDATTPVAPQI
jgi:hypothetical protein